MVRTLIVCIAALGSLCGCSSAPAWKFYRSDTGGFEVMVPGTLLRRTQAIPGPSGETTISTYTLDAAGCHFAVIYSDFPRRDFTAADADGLVRDAIPQLTGGKSAPVRQVKLQGYTGHEFSAPLSKEAVSGGATVTARIFFVKDRMYQVSVVVYRGKGSAADAARYLNSFRLTGA